jgi:hypothetical protein
MASFTKYCEPMGISKIIELVRKAEAVYVWCNWHEHDGNYFKAEKIKAIKVLQSHLLNGEKVFNVKIEFDDETMTKPVVWLG